MLSRYIHLVEYVAEALLCCAMFCGACLATPLRDQLHEILPNVTHSSTARNFARQVAETVSESRTWPFLLQRFQLTFRNPLLDKLQKLQCVTVSYSNNYYAHQCLASVVMCLQCMSNDWSDKTGCYWWSVS